VLPIIREVQAARYKSANSIAVQLNARKVATARGGRWTHVQVGQIIKQCRGQVIGAALTRCSARPQRGRIRLQPPP
jgi:hypothetical protein